MNTQGCTICGCPGMTQFETGKWLCKKHSPFTTLDTEPQFDVYTKQKGIELAFLFTGLTKIVKQLSENSSDKELLSKAIQLVTIKTEFHPLTFFLNLNKFEVEAVNRYLQDGNIAGLPNIYSPEEYTELIDNSNRFWAKMVGNSTNITSVSFEVLMNLPGRIGYDNKDKFIELPVKDKPSDEHVICSKCEGRGFWNIWVPGYGARHIVNDCPICNMIGWIDPSNTKRTFREHKNWMYLPKEKRYTFGYARPNEQTGAKLKIARVKSKIDPDTLEKKLSTFLGENITLYYLREVEAGKLPLFDKLYIAIGELTNTILAG